MLAREEQALGAFIRAHRDDILRTWERRVQALPKARRLSRPHLVDHVPEMLERVAASLETRDNRAEVRNDVGLRAGRHGDERRQEGFDLEDALLEVAMLRDAALEIRGAASVRSGEQAILIVRAFDPIFAGVVRCFQASRA